MKKLFYLIILFPLFLLETYSADSNKSWYGLFYLSLEYDSNPVQVQDQDPTHQEDYLSSVYLNLAKIWKPKSESWRGKHEVHYYEARYKDNDTLNFRLLGLKESFTYRAKTSSYSLQLKNQFVLEHYDVDDQDFLYSYAYRPELIIFHKKSKLYYIINAQLNFSEAYRDANQDNEGHNRQLDFTILKKYHRDSFKSHAFSIFINDHEPELNTLQYLESGLKAQLEFFINPLKLKLLPSVTWSKEDYATVNSTKRKDDEIKASLHLQRTFKDIHSLDLGFNYIDHSSNDSNEEYDKFQVQLSYGVLF